MRATGSISSLRHGKRRLLGSCAIAAGMAALSLGGPAMAQGVNGTGAGVAGPGLSAPTIGPGFAPNTTQVTTTGPQTVINWTPTDTDPNPAAGAIDFLPTGNNLNFYGTGQYVVLNRFIGPAANARQIALNGNVNGFTGAPSPTGGNPTGGNIWFYNAGGILIGANAVINVGSLVLTANDIDFSDGSFFGPGGIRFRGVAGSRSAVTVAQGASITAGNGNPGSSYVALVAPRIVQAGTVSTDGSTAYVAAEAADIRINNGLFDINVLIGAEGGNVITHTGTTTGPAHVQDDPNDNRVYMVAVPKNDAVTMLVSGRIGYQDAMAAQIDPDGAVVLSAGYNIVGGAIADAPVNATAANITVNDTIFESSVTAHASGAFVGQPIGTIAQVVPPLTPPGRILVRGDASFAGDASATITVAADQAIGATGNFSLVSSGGAATINVNGGTLASLGTINLTAGGVQQADGSAVGEDAALIVNGGQVGATAIVVASIGQGGIGTNGAGGLGTGGNATIRVTGAGSTLTADTISIQSVGTGGGLTFDSGGVASAVDIGGDGMGGNATLIVENGGSLTANALLSVDANGVGQTGNVQSGTGTGGTARIQLTGSGSSINAGAAIANALGVGGSDFSQQIALDVVTQNGGAGIGGTAQILISGDTSTIASLGTAGARADGIGGGARGTNPNGGDGRGGNASVTVTGGVFVTANTLGVIARGDSGGASGGIGETDTGGDAFGGTATLAVDNNSFLSVAQSIFLDAGANATTADNKGTSSGGNVLVQATSGGSISAQNEFAANAAAGEFSFQTVTSNGASTGGNIDLVADGGSISGGYFSVNVGARTRNTSQTTGAAQGGTIDFLASNNGAITATNSGDFSFLSADALTGYSVGGADATGGTIQLIADGGQINVPGFLQVSASGISGGDLSFGTGAVPKGLGGSILIQALGSTSGISTLAFGDIFASSDGSSGITVEGIPQLDELGAADGTGGNITVDIQDGIVTANSAFFSASGFGGAVATSGGTGTGGTAIFTQTGGQVDVGDLFVGASGEGGYNLIGGPGGTGIGGTATINLYGGTINASSIGAAADGNGGPALPGDDNPTVPQLATDGGNGFGGIATVNLEGTATVTVGTLSSAARGNGATGGNFFSDNDGIGDTGDGGGGFGGSAAINLRSGDITAGTIIADAAGIGGTSGSFFTSSSSGPPTVLGVGGSGGDGRGGSSVINQDGATVTVTDLISSAIGMGGSNGNLGGPSGNGQGGEAVVNLFNGNLDAQSITATAGGIGGIGDFGTDFFFNPARSGDGGDGQGGSATVNLDGAATVTAAVLNSLATGTGGRGGDFQTNSNRAADAGDAGDGFGGDANVNLVAGDLSVGDLRTDASGFGGDGGALSSSSSSGAPTGVGAGGFGGTGRGGTATIDFQTAIDATGTVGSYAGALGGSGGFNSVGGEGGEAYGGTAQAIITDIDAGDFAVVLDTAATGGNGGSGFDGAGGRGGAAQGGISRVQIDGPNGAAVISQGNFFTTGTGGNGGTAFLAFGNNPPFGPSGGDGGYGFGGTVEIVANDGVATIGVSRTGVAGLGSGGIGGDGGRGADNNGTMTLPGPDGILGTMDDVVVGFVGGNGGIAGGGVGGTVHLVANGGTITSDGAPVAIAVNGTSGNGGDGGTGFGGNGACCSGFVDEGGSVLLESFTSENGSGQIIFGDTSIDATGFIAGRIDIVNNSDGVGINLASLDASVFGFPRSPIPSAMFDSGIRIASANGQIVVDGDVALNSDSEIRFDMDGDGQLVVGGSLTAFSSILIAATHTNQTNFNPGVSVDGDINFDSAGNIISDVDSQFSAGGDLTFNAAQSIDFGTANAGGNTSLISSGSTNAIGASAGGDVYVEGGSVGVSFASSGASTTLLSTGSDVFFGTIDSGDVTTITSFAGVVGGTIDAGTDVIINAGAGGQIDSIFAGDDIRVTFGGPLTIGTMGADGSGSDDDEDGSNIEISAGDTQIGHAEANNNFFADVASFSTGLNSIITGGDIDIIAVGAADLGNSTAGGHIDVDADSIAFNALEAGGYVDLNIVSSGPVTGDIIGGTILAGSDVNLLGGNIAIDMINASGSLFATAGGMLAVDQASVGGFINANAAGNLTGNYEAQGDISLNAGGDILASASATGFDNSSSGTPFAASVFIDAGGDVVLTDGFASSMMGVNAGGSASISNATAGEDILILAGTNAVLNGVTAGDDLTVIANGAITASGLNASGDGDDFLRLAYNPNLFGFTIFGGEGASEVNGADITLTSTNGAIDAAGLSAGDDILLTAATGLTVNGATTLGLGVTDGDSSILTTSGDASFSGLDAFDDIGIDATGAVSFTGQGLAGRDIGIDAASVTLAFLSAPGGESIDTLVAGGELSIVTSGSVSDGSAAAGNRLSIIAGTTLAIGGASSGGDLSLNGMDGVFASSVQSGGQTNLISDAGAINVGLQSVGPVSAIGDSIAITGSSSDLVFSQLSADVGDASVRSIGNIAFTNATVAGNAAFESTNGSVSVSQLTASDATLFAAVNLTLGNVSVDNFLLAEAQRTITVNGGVTAADMSVGSGDIVIAPNGRLGSTFSLDIRNTDSSVQTFIGGTGARNGYHIDADELTRVTGGSIAIFAPRVNTNDGAFVASAPGALPVPIASIGSSAQPDVVIDDFTMTAGGSTSNFDANGSLTISTPGKARVIGDVVLTGLSDDNAFNLFADDSLEVIMGQGSIRLTGAGNTPGGMLNLQSDDVIVATMAAINAVGAATTTAAIDARLAQNDGITSNDGALFAGGINVNVVGGFYVQNSGAGTDFAQRRGLTFGSQGLSVGTVGNSTRIVVNGVGIGPNGQVTGLDTIPLLTINVGEGSSTGGVTGFDPLSTLNGCLIANPASCSVIIPPPPETNFERGFPVQDVIEDEEESEGEDADGIGLPIPLITMREIDPLSGEPLLDDPVTGAGNDDLWTPPVE